MVVYAPFLVSWVESPTPRFYAIAQFEDPAAFKNKMRSTIEIVYIIKKISKVALL